MSLFNLKNKSVLITGSSKGIGKAIAYQCAEHGARVIISSRKLDICEQTAVEINTKIGRELAYAIPANISDDDQLEKLVNETEIFCIKFSTETFF